MKTAREVIESGILEEYVLGILTDSEKEEVEKYILQYPEVQQVVFELQEGLFKYSLQYKVSPKPSLKNEILSKIKNTPFVEAPPAQNHPFLLYVLALVLGILAITFAILWQNEVKNSTKLNQQFSHIKNEYQNCQNNYQDLKRNYDNLILGDKSYQTIKLQDDKTNVCLATIYWNSTSKKGYYQVEQFPDLPQNKVYRLWCVANKTPVDAGILKKSEKEKGLKPIKKVCENVEAFAVTIEDKLGEDRTTLPRPEEIFIYTPLSDKK
ncbi:MAG: anti-sigma factor [Bacteroidia bacterium]|nr:anti-sigma factor [Bacteroidia bacterium]MDW8346558.1 anti-sigma factor [Bacteroidia bacterium]